MIKKILLALLLILSINPLFAQNIKIIGQVIDSLSSIPLPSALVTIINRENQKVIFIGVVEDSEGTFAFDKINTKGAICDVIVEYVGYKKRIIPLVENLGIIRLTHHSLLIDDVTVVGSISVRQNIDKITYIVDSLDLSRVSVTTDVLRKIPEIAVNELRRTATIMGKENTLVLQNGINTGVSIDLRTIDFRNIARIEVITSTSSGVDNQFDGIINIVMKSKVPAGISVDLEQSTKLDFRSNDTYIGATWSKEKVSLKFTYSNSYRANQFDIKEYRYSDNGIDSYEKDGYAADPFEVINDFGLNLDYHITSNDFFNITTSTKFTRADKSIDYSTTNLGDLNSQFNNDYFIGNYTLYYRHTMQDKQTDYLSVNANFGYMDATEDINSTYDSGIEYINNEIANKFSTTLRVEYNNQLNRTLRLNTGVQSYYQDFRNMLNSETNDNNLQNYRTNIYADLFATVGKWNFRVGVKGEININDFKSSLYESTNQLLLQPIASAMYKFDKTHSLSLEYRRPASYPSAWILSPHSLQVDEKSIIVGNPDLLLTKRDNIGLTYTYRTDMITLSASPVYQYSSNIIIPQMTFDTDLNSTTKYVNGGSSNLVGMDIYGALNFLKGAISIEPDLFMGYGNMMAGDLVQRNFYYRAGGSVNLYLPHGFGLGVYGSCRGKYITINGYSESRYSIDALYIMKRFEKSGLNLFFGYQSLAQSADVDYVLSDNYTQRSYFESDTKGFILRINYYFNTGKNRRMKSIDTYFDTDRK